MLDKMSKQVLQLLAASPANPASGSALTYVDASTGQFLTKNSAGTIQPANFLSSVFVSSSVAASRGYNHLVRSDVAAYTLTLDATIEAYSVLMVTDAGRNANSNNITIARNGNTINGAAEDYVIGDNGGWAMFLGDPTNTDWILLSASQSSSSESGTNYFENGNFESNATDGVAASGSAPTIGEEITTPLYGIRSSKITTTDGSGGSVTSSSINTGGIFVGDGQFAATQASTSGSGTGFTCTVTVSGGAVTSIDSIDSGGLGYLVSETITLTGIPNEILACILDVDAVTAAGNGIIDYNIGLIDNGVVESLITTQISAHLKTDALVANGDWTAGVYDTTLAAYVVEPTDLVADSINIYRTPFVPLFVTADRYKLRCEFTDSTAGRVLITDKLNMTPDSNSGLVPAAPDSEVYIHTASASNSGQGTVGIRIAVFVGTLETTGSGITYFSDTVNGDTFTVNEAGRYAITATMGTSAGDNQWGISKNATVGEQATAIQSIDGSRRIALSNNNASLPVNIAVTVKLEVGDVIRYHGSGGTPQNLEARCNIRITQVAKDDTVNLLTQDVVQANVRGSWTITTSPYTPANSPIDFDTEVANMTTGTWANTNGEITIPVDGVYDISAIVRNNGNWSAAVGLQLFVDAVETCTLDKAGSTTKSVLAGSYTLFLSKGQVVEISATETAGGLSTSASDTNLTIVRQPDYGAFTPVGFGLATPTAAGLAVKPNSYIRINDSNGFGSTDTKIRRFSNEVANVGTGITRASTAANGDTFTINESGVYAISYTDGFNSATTISMGISLNSTELTTDIGSISADDRLGVAGAFPVNSFRNVSWTGPLVIGDIIRPHGQTVGAGGTTEKSTFTITQLSAD